MFYYPWLTIVLLLLPVIITIGLIALIVQAVMNSSKYDQSDNAKNKRERKANAMLKNIYLYLVLFVTLMMSIGGSVGVFVGLSNYVAPDTYVETYDQYKQNKCGNNHIMPYYGENDIDASEDTGITADEDSEMDKDVESDTTDESSDDTSVSSEDSTSVESSEMRIQPWPYPSKSYCDEAQLRDNYDDMVQELEDDEKGRAIKTMIQSLGWILIPLPIFIYFQRQLNQHNSDAKRRVKDANEE